MVKRSKDRKCKEYYQSSITVRGVDPELKRKFKAICAEREVTIQDAVIELIEKVIHRKEKPNGHPQGVA